MGGASVGSVRDFAPSDHIVPSRSLGRPARVHLLDILVGELCRRGYVSVAFAVEVGGDDALAFRICVRVLGDDKIAVGSPRWREATALIGIEHFDRVASEATRAP